MTYYKLQIGNAIAIGRMAMRIEQDKRDWLKQAIEQGRKDLKGDSNEVLTVS